MDARDVVGQELVSLTHPDDCPLVEDAHGAGWRDGETVTTIHRLRCAGGCHRWIESRSRSIDTCDMESTPCL